jgi:hypothetical protein
MTSQEEEEEEDEEEEEVIVLVHVGDGVMRPLLAALWLIGS